MTKYNFDEIICRNNTFSVKNDFCPEKDMISMWVADMDFAVAPPILEAIRCRANHPIFGYSYIPDSFFETVSNWYEKRHHYVYDPKQLIPFCGVVSALSVILLSLTQEGDVVTLQAPTYMNFPPAITGINRKIVYNQLINRNNHYEIDFDDLERCLSQSKVFVHCSPHNPTGRVWTLSEQKRIAELCEKYHVLVISDEIHSDLIMPGFSHIPFMSVSHLAPSYTITTISATKTFNLAHNGMAFMAPGNPIHYEKIKHVIESMHLGSMNIFAMTAVKAAYESGEDWLDSMLKYVYDNYRFVKERFEKTMKRIVVNPLEGTYLVWLDCRNLDQSVVDFFETNGRVYGEDGILFGPAGEKYYRMNIATSRLVLEDVVNRLETTYRRLYKGE